MLESNNRYITVALSVCIWILPLLFEIIAFTASLATFPWQFTPMIIPAQLVSFVLAIYAGSVTNTTKPRCGVLTLAPSSATVIAFYVWIVCRMINIILFAIFNRGLEPIITYIVSIVLGCVIYVIMIFIIKLSDS